MLGRFLFKTIFRLIIILIIIVFFLKYEDLVSCPVDNICSLADEEVSLRGKIVSWPAKRLEKTFLEIEIISVEEEKSKVGGKTGRLILILPHSEFDFSYQSQIVFRGKIKIPKTEEGEHFSYPLYLAGQGIYALMYDPEISEILPAENLNLKDRFFRTVADWREEMRWAVDRKLTEPAGSLLKAIVLGDQGEIPEQTRNELGKTGLVHILSISGSHITFLVLILGSICLEIGLSKKRSFVLVLIVILAYLILSGAPACAKRSGIMGLVAMFAFFRGRLPDMKALFFLSMLILMIENPLAPLSDIGFQLSYLAVFAMIFVFPWLNKIFFWGREGGLVSGAQILLFSATVGLFTLPLTAYYFGIMAWISPFSNLILAPLISLFLPIGILFFAFVSVESAIGYAGYGFSDLMALSLHFLWRLVDLINELFLKVPFAFEEKILSGKMNFFIYFILGVTLIFMRNWFLKKGLKKRLAYFKSPLFLEKKKSHLQIAYGKIRRKINFLEKIKTREQYFYWSVVIGCCALLFLVGFYFYHDRLGPRVVFLDVGQGDAILIDFPPYHLQFLIDGGPGRRVMAELGEVLPFYDRKIEFMFLTHYHQDHLEGLISVLNRYRVETIFLPYLKTGEDYSLDKIFLERLQRETNVKIILARAGQSIKLKDQLGEEILALKLLSPFFDYSKFKIKDPNNESLIVKIEKPKTLLFTGDATFGLEKVLLEKFPEELRASLLKVGHHGSRFSSSNLFLEAVNPDQVIISVGKNNAYKHPASATLERLKNRSVETKRTDEEKEIINFKL